MINQRLHVLEQKHHVLAVGIEFAKSIALSDDLLDFTPEFLKLFFIHGVILM